MQERPFFLQCPLWVCPDLGDYQTDGTPFHLGLAGKHQHSNASLALQLSNSWLKKRCSPGEFCSTSQRHIWYLLLAFCSHDYIKRLYLKWPVKSVSTSGKTFCSPSRSSQCFDRTDSHTQTATTTVPFLIALIGNTFQLQISLSTEH